MSIRNYALKLLLCWKCGKDEGLTSLDVAGQTLSRSKYSLSALATTGANVLDQHTA